MDLINPRTGLHGKTKLKQKFPHLSQEIDNNFLTNEAFIVNQPLRKKFNRRIIAAKRVDLIWQSDLADVSRFEDENDGIRFLKNIW